MRTARVLMRGARSSSSHHTLPARREHVCGAATHTLSASQEHAAATHTQSARREPCAESDARIKSRHWYIK